MGAGQQSTHSVWLHSDKILENTGCLHGDDGLVLSFTAEANKLTKASQGRKSLIWLAVHEGMQPTTVKHHEKRGSIGQLLTGSKKQIESRA